MYKKGEVIDKFMMKVVYWYEKVVENNEFCVVYNLVLLYEKGDGVE